MTAIAKATIDASLSALFQKQARYQKQIGLSSARERIAKLKRLERVLFEYRAEVQEALARDFRKPATEVDLVEIYPVLSEIRFAVRNLKRWTRAQPVPTPIALLGARSYIQYQPKGVVLIIAPWNFPVNLALVPLVSAIAAGNSAIVKPSEHTPYTSAMLKKIVGQAFDEEDAAVAEGGVDTAQALLELPFNHIFFTGSPSIGKVVMAAAAKHLASVTLELGGKSPVIIDETADLSRAAARIAMVKFANAGQVCLAPDYVFVHESRKEAFLVLLEQAQQKYYGRDARESDDYVRIVNARHFERLKGYLDEALARGAKAAFGGQAVAEERYIAPTAITGVPEDAQLMTEEIFGPLLPVYPFRELQEAIRFINAREKPLAIYVYSKSRRNIRAILEQTRAGGTCINHNGIHYYNPHLPFGGDNHSGIGKSHGWFGFETFSNARAIFQQTLPWNASDFIPAPYTRWRQKIADVLLRWL